MDEDDSTQKYDKDGTGFFVHVDNHGTLYIEGALPGKHILRGGKPVAIRLPKLDKGYIYSDFVISGTTLYAAWEATDFYKIKRSGFLSVDLDSTLYSRVR